MNIDTKFIISQSGVFRIWWFSSKYPLIALKGLRMNSCKYLNAVTIENRIYIYREEFTRKKCKTAILLYCFNTAGGLHVYALYNLWALENLKLILKETQIIK